MHRAIGVGEGARFLAPERGRQHHVRERRRLTQKRILDNEEEALPPQQAAHARQFRQRHGRIGSKDPEQSDRAGLRVTEDLHRMRRRTPVRNLRRLDVPKPRQLLDVPLVIPVAEGDQLAVGPAFARVLRRWLAIHLEDR